MVPDRITSPRCSTTSAPTSPWMATSSTWASGTLQVLLLLPLPRLKWFTCAQSLRLFPSFSVSFRARGLQQAAATELQGRRCVRAGFLPDQQGQL